MTYPNGQIVNPTISELPPPYYLNGEDCTNATNYMQWAVSTNVTEQRKLKRFEKMAETSVAHPLTETLK